MSFDRVRFDSYMLRSSLAKHKRIKSKLLKLINKSPAEENGRIVDEYYNDNITRNYFNSGDDFTRPWIKYFFKYLKEYLMSVSHELGYGEIRINRVWFQQYDKDSLHNWHLHENNYTGVYYLDMPKGSAPTEFINPSNFKEKFINHGQEGDIISFPCYIIHRAAQQKVKGRKTIISWNLDFEKIRPDLVNTL